MKSSQAFLLVSFLAFACGREHDDKTSAVNYSSGTSESTQIVEKGVTRIQDRVDFEENFALASESGNCQFLVPRTLDVSHHRNNFIADGENWRTMPDYRENFALQGDSIYTYTSEFEDEVKVLTIELLDGIALVSGSCIYK